MFTTYEVRYASAITAAWGTGVLFADFIVTCKVVLDGGLRMRVPAAFSGADALAL